MRVSVGFIYLFIAVATVSGGDTAGNLWLANAAFTLVKHPESQREHNSPVIA